VWIKQGSKDLRKVFRDTQNVFTVKKLDAVILIEVLRLIADSVKMLQLVGLLVKDL